MSLLPKSQLLVTTAAGFLWASEHWRPLKANQNNSIKISMRWNTGERGADNGERAEKQGSGGGATSGVQGRAPGWGSVGRGDAPWSWKLFVHFYTKKWPKVKDLSENLPPCLSRAAMTSPKFWSMGAAAAQSAHSWIRHCKPPTHRTKQDVVPTPRVRVGDGARFRVRCGISSNPKNINI